MNDRCTHRLGTVTINVGTEHSNKPVVVKQVKHDFLFGCAEFSVLPFVAGQMDEAEQEQAKKRFGYMEELLNSVTLPFYWGRFEPEEGNPDTKRMKDAAKWLKDRGMTLKGHPLCWHTVCAPWLLEKSNEEIYQIQMERVERDVAEFAGLIDMWDVINEAVIMPIFDKYDNGITRICKERGRIPLIRDLFAKARATNPKATLLINDFDMTESYDILIEGVLESGIKIDTIGLQSHMHKGVWSKEKTEEVLERFSRFKLPLHFTEVTIVSGHIMPKEIVDLNDYQLDSWPSTPEGEERQAKETVEFYEALYANPWVEAITWWSFNDGLWLGAPGGFLDNNSDPKPVYHELHKRIKGDWWTAEKQLQSDAHGNVEVTGTKGEYVAICDGKEICFSVR